MEVADSEGVLLVLFPDTLGSRNAAAAASVTCVVEVEPSSVMCRRSLASCLMAHNLATMGFLNCPCMGILSSSEEEDDQYRMPLLLKQRLVGDDVVAPRIV